MAKEDFCFTYYDGDAARDKAHMNRLERGAYDDIISAQRKRGHLSLEDIKKVLSGDFEKCWGSMEWILLKDETGKFYIEWVDKSLEKMRRQSRKQSENVSKRWNKDTTDIPNEYHGNDLVMPLVNGNEDENEIGNEFKGVQGGKEYLIPEMFSVFKKEIKTYPGSVKYDYKPLLSIANFLCDQASVEGGPENNVDKVLQAWKSVCLVIKDDNFYSQKSLSTISNHIQEILQQALHGKKSNHSKVSVKPTTDDLKAAHARRYPVGQ